MSAFSVIVITVLLIVLSAFFVVIEFALLGARRHRLEAEATTSRSARAALRGAHELTIMLAVAQLGITACTFALGAVTKPAVDYALSPLFAEWGLPAWLADGGAFAISLVFVTFLHLVVGEMAPKSWAIAHPETAAKIIGVPSRAFAWVFRPLLLWINAMANRLVAASGITPVDRAAVGGQDVDTIRALVEHSASVGTLEAPFRRQLSDVLELERLTVGDLIRSRGLLTSVGLDASVDDVRRAAAESGHLRILMTDEQGSPSRLIHVRDCLLEAPDRPAESIARSVLTLDAATAVYEALAQMRASSEQLALVAREGEVVGVLTVTDILRRIMPRDGARKGSSSLSPTG
ncbi:CNNM domain-containing protein [Actinoalloteichus hymeniacidonis]|uniref:CBS domain-containing protein n=1 Tax=Actinoalloteichus hymeniacidonis TaxID=340345 RepID=A0AAC9HNB4_9PSEU|nr:hemolysin family protein [Actinoalloteichus hymeniacidonis]AOS61881.1 CBS domain-containing protein [Actinoalloteichus hymeniacidonis]MBB5910099.1 CBS domain containing-hemolysin-like protein [Actinoalloteichus hymeniacidonis]